MKPKPYRKKKSSKGSDITGWNTKGDNGGGKVKGTIIGPMTSVGTVDKHPAPNQGMKKELETL